MATAAVVPISERASNPAKRARLEISKSTFKPASLDEKAKQWLNLKLQEDKIAKELEAAYDEFMKLINLLGVRSSKAEKSKRVNGAIYFAQATYGSNTAVDPQAVERFMLAMIDAGMDKKLAGALFESLFVFSPKYSLASNALKVITGKLPKGSPRNLRHLFHQAVSITPKKPSLKVDEIKAAK